METKVEDVANVIPKANEINNIKGKTVQKNEKTSDLEQNGSSAENGIFSEEKQSENHQARRSLRILKEKEEADEKSKLETNEEISAGKSQLSSENSSPIDNSTAKNKTSSKLSSPKKNLSEKSNNDQVSSDAEIPTIDEKEESEIEKIEEKKQSEPSSEYKILRRSVRISESLNSSPGSSSVSSLKLDEPTSYRHSRENYLGRVTGRRPVRGHLTPYRKRKITDDPEESIDDSIGPNSKRTAVDSPSVKSPGWKYLPSLNKLWSPREDMSEGISVVSSTPYRSATQYSDSMVVNYDEKTVQRFQDSDVEGVEETTPSSGWYCSLM
ncbi:hypothetical protein AAG570_009889 [Ranatra chinensis]|uniref:Uncharacterized protein n=1 Tax=Ranatra chinensis TaxID=642074 RepID=A0ABD0YQI0_9HEMI